jgi:hypothetical protein
VSAPVDWLPDGALGPDHAPEAEQEVASVEDQVSIAAPPLVTDVGFAASDKVGLMELFEEEPSGLTSPQPANARTSTGTNSSVFMRNIGNLISFLPPMSQLNQVSCNCHNPLH